MTRTTQEEFDIVMDHLRRQGRRSVANNTCLYRDFEGGKCAIGALIPDEDYDPGMEHLFITELVKSAKSLNTRRSTFYAAMQQRLHDDLEDDEFRFHLELAAQKFCDEYRLTYTYPPKDL